MKTSTAELPKAEAPPMTPTGRRNSLDASQRFKELAFARNSFMATIPNDVPYEAVLEPGYWVSVARRLRIGDAIFVRPDSLTWEAELRAVSVDPATNAVEVREYYRKDIGPAVDQQADTAAFRIEYRGLADQWTVVRKSDGKVMRTGFADKPKARDFINADLTARLV